LVTIDLKGRFLVAAFRVPHPVLSTALDAACEKTVAM
jgi:hypothetical protein